MGGGFYLDIKKDFADYDHDAECIEAIKYSLVKGQNHIDTALAYGGGHTDELIAKAIKGLDRSKIYIAEKVPKSHMRRTALAHSVDQMLAVLGLDYLDLLYIHDVNIQEPMEGYIAALDELVDRGIVREIAISNANLEQTKKAVSLAKHPIAANQIQMNLLTRVQATQELLDYCKQQCIKVVAYQPLQNPFFFIGLKDPVIEEIAAKYGKSIQQIALNWLIKHQGVIAIPKAIKKEHIDANLQSLDFAISSSDLERLDHLA
jgi:diketogulonate reductase-like aldo/keto reductase